MSTDGRTPTRGGSSDWRFCLLVAAAIVAYLLVWPNDLGHGDESYFLLESKRISDGEVLYRDIFWFATPLAHWIMAAVFRVFGASIEVARTTMALLHGITAVLLCAAARRLGVRRSLAAIPPVAFVALCQTTFPYAVPHWFATTVMAAVLFVVADRGTNGSSRHPVALGLLIGALTCLYLQQGAAFFVVLAAWLTTEHVAERWIEPRRNTHTLVADLVLFAAPTAAVVIPVLVWMIWSAGFHSVLDQTIIHPLTGYAEFNRSSWAQVNLLTARAAQRTYPVLFRWLPLLLAVGGVRAVWRLLRRDESFRVPLRLVAVCGASALSILYMPDFIHVGFIAGMFFVFAAETVEASLAWIGGDGIAARLCAAALSVLLLTVLGMKAWSNLALTRRQHPISYETAFGRIDLENEWHRDMIARTNAFLKSTDSRQMFAYPVFTSLYLTSGGKNATRFQILLHKYNSPEHQAEVLKDLETKQVPLVVVCERFVPADDAIVHYVHQHYRVLYDPKTPDRSCVIWGRNGVKFGGYAEGDGLAPPG